MAVPYAPNGSIGLVPTIYMALTGSTSNSALLFVSHTNAVIAPFPHPPSPKRNKGDQTGPPFIVASFGTPG